MSEPRDPADAPPEAKGGEATPPSRPPVRWRAPALLFVATVAAVFFTEASRTLAPEQGSGLAAIVNNLASAWTFAVPLLTILLAHEFGHYLAARWHRVPASLPYFLPLPSLSPFGTMGAVISMPGRIRSRNALLDIGAAGPLAGMVVALPVLIIGLSQSEVRDISGPALIEGNCLLYMLLKWLVFGPIPAGQDVWITPAAFAGWAGLLVTALNLLPIGQLDGGHIAYALLGPRQNGVARVLHWLLPLVFAYNLWTFDQVEPGMVWLVWFALLFVLRRFSGASHPPTEPGELSPGRRIIAIVCVVLFILLFMPTPLRLV